MEIIQNIWTALTTENISLTQIITFPLAILETLLTMFLFLRIFDIKSNTKQKIIYIVSFMLIGMLANAIIPVPYNTFINLLSCFVLIIVVFKVCLFKSILSQLIPYFLFVIVGILVHNTYMSLTGITTDMIVTVPIHKLITSLFTNLIVFCFYKIISYFKLHIYVLENMRQRITSILVINFMFGIFAICVQAYIFSIYIEIIPYYLTLLNVGVLLFYFIFSLYSLIRTNSLEKTRQDLEQSQQYNKTLTILHDNIRCFKHDFNNIVTTIGGYVQSGDMDGLKKYYTELQGDCQKVNNLSALSPSVINEPAIYSLLANKYHLADANGITINLEVFIDLTELKIKPYEFTRILRNFNG